MPLLTRTRPPADRAGAAAAEAIDRARDAAAPTVERAREASRPVLGQLRSAVGTVLRLVVRVAALVPGVGAQVLQGVASVMGRLADSTAQIADVDPPSKVRRRGSRRRAGLWFAGGFVAGAAAGYAAHEMMARDRPHRTADEVEAAWPPAGRRTDGPTAQVPG